LQTLDLIGDFSLCKLILPHPEKSENFESGDKSGASFSAEIKNG
jgi:hypothetical protein